jgi:putative transposase
MIRLTVEQAASLLGISERAVRKNAANGTYGAVEYEPGQRGGASGRVLLIPLTGLPAKAQAMYWSAKAETPAVNDDLAGLTDEEREDVGNKQRILAAWRQYREANKGSGNARQIDQRFVRMWTSVYKDKLSVATLHRWDKTQREQGAKALADKRGKARAGESSIPDDLWAIYEAEYMNQNKRTHMECYKLVRDFACLHNREHEVPHESAFRRRAKKEFDRNILVFMREGPKAWASLVAPHLTLDRTSLPPGGMFEMDHTQLDLACLDENGRIIRPWVSAMVDFRTRKWVGWKLCENPSQESTMAAFYMAASNPEVGIPDALKLDNGREYTGLSFAGRGFRKSAHKVEFDEARIRSMVEFLHINVYFSTPEHPQSKGGIERGFGPFHEAICKAFEGYVGNCPSNRPEAAAEIQKSKKGLKTLAEIEPMISEAITYVLNEEPHSAPDMKGMSRRQKWDADIHLRPVKHVQKDVLKMLCMPYAGGRLYTVTKSGLKVWGHRYWCIELVEHLGEKVAVRYDQTDGAHVYVFRPDGSYLTTAKIMTPVAHGVSTDEVKEMHKATARLAKQNREYQKQVRAAALGDPLGVRIAAGKKRLEEEKAQQPATATAAVAQLHTEVPTTVRQAAKEVAAARAEILAGQKQAAACGGGRQPESGRMVTNEWIMSVVNGSFTPPSPPQGDGRDNVRRLLHLVK